MKGKQGRYHISGRRWNGRQYVPMDQTQIARKLKRVLLASNQKLKKPKQKNAKRRSLEQLIMIKNITARAKNYFLHAHIQ